MKKETNQRKDSLKEERRIFEAVSVKDRLPKKAGWYFVMLNQDQATGRQDEASNCYFTVKQKWGKRPFARSITHWLEERPLSSITNKQSSPAGFICGSQALGENPIQQKQHTEEFESEIEIGELLIRSADEDGDFYIKIGKHRSTSLGTEEMKDIVRFINYHLSQYEV